MTKPNLLWVGDACMATGFARVTHNVVPRLQEKFNVTVLGIGYRGDPHKYDYEIYPAKAEPDDDSWGVARLPKMVEVLAPDIVLVNNDPWNVIRFCNRVDIPIVGYMPVDAPNFREDVARNMNRGVALSIFYTHFAVEQARLGGYAGMHCVVPHGVDAELYQPIPKHEAWKHVGLYGKIADDSFIIGAVNRNQPRKRLDLTIQAFAKFTQLPDVQSNAYLLVHCAQRDLGWDLKQLASYFGVLDRCIFTDTKGLPRWSIVESMMPYIYNSFDIQISTTLGEGWGLTTHEGMACGIPQIVPDWAALGEWCKDVVRFVPIQSIQAQVGNINSLGGVVDVDKMAKAMHQLYLSKESREEYSKLGLERARQPEYRWDTIGGLLGSYLERVVNGTLVNLTAAAREEALGSLDANTAV